MSFVIAVDGPAASGKGTVASALARHFSLPYLDTGLLYRAVGYAALRHDPPFEETQAALFAANEVPDALDDPAYRTAEVGEAASRVAAMPAVRAGLLDFQKRYAARPHGAVIDGRDIGTIIAPEAPAKLFVTARPEIRAERRWKQLKSQGQDLSFETVLEDIRRRDERDSGRSTAPLVQAADAHLLDTSEMTIEAAFREALRLVEQARSS